MKIISLPPSRKQKVRTDEKKSDVIITIWHYISTDINKLCIIPQRLEQEIEEIQPSFRVGSVLFSTERLRLALVTETHNWKLAYAKALNDKCAHEMDSIMDFIDGLMKRLCRPIKDLDDVRTAMAGLNEIRENEVCARYILFCFLDPTHLHPPQKCVCKGSC